MPVSQRTKEVCAYYNAQIHLHNTQQQRLEAYITNTTENITSARKQSTTNLQQNGGTANGFAKKRIYPNVRIKEGKTNTYHIGSMYKDAG